MPSLSGQPIRTVRSKHAAPIVVAAAVLASSASAQVLTSSAPLPRAGSATLAPSLHQAADSVPYVRFEQSDFNGSGHSDPSLALRTLLPSLNRPHPAIEDGSAHLPPFTLRGLSPDHSVVLVNGHRRPTSALLNVNGTIGRGGVSASLALPLAAVAQIEVLPDGSDTRYASGAFAGAVNLALHEELGRKLSVHWGRTAEGDGEVRQAVLSAGTALGQKGVLHITVAWRDQDSTDRAATDTRQQYLGVFTGSTVAAPLANAIDSGTSAPPTGITFDPREATANREAQRYGDPSVYERSLVFNSRLPTSATNEFYAFGDFSYRHSESAVFFRRPGDSRVVRALWPDGLLPLIDTRLLSWHLAAGWRGRAAEWHYDAIVQSSSDSITYDVNNSNNATLGAASPRSFYSGKLSNSEVRAALALSRPVSLGLTQPASLRFGLEARRERFQISPGDPDSWRDGGALILDGPDAGRRPPEGAAGFPGFRPIDAIAVHRTVAATDLELSQRIGHRLQLAGSGRYEKTEDSGETADSKASARINLFAGLALRGSIGIAQRTPHLAQRWFSSTANNFIGGVPFRIRTFTVDDPVARALDAQDLRPERAHTINAGLVWQPSPRFGAEVDFYRVDLRDRLILSSNFVGSAVSTFLETRGISGVTGARFFTNDAATRTEGYEARAHHTIEVGPHHRVRLQAAYAFHRAEMTHIGPTPSGLAAVGVTTPLFDLTEVIRLTRSQPRDNFRFGANWEWRRFAARLDLARYGEWESVALTNVTPEQTAALLPGYRLRSVVRTLPRAEGSSGSGPQIGAPSTATDLVQVFDAKWVTDLSLQYRISDVVRWTIGAANLFDVMPTRNVASRLVGGQYFSGADNAGTTPYHTSSPFGFNGAYYYTRVEVQF